MAGQHDASDIVLFGAGFGDEGKGSAVDFIARAMTRSTGAAPLVARFNGGPQAAHRVVAPDGRSHIFAQFGSGSFLPGAPTLLGPEMLVDPIALEVEAVRLEQVLGCSVRDRVLADENCVVVTPYHRLTNRVREILRGASRHGSCGLGVGEARFDALAGKPHLRLGQLRHQSELVRELAAIRRHKLHECHVLLSELARALPSADAAEIIEEISLHEGEDLVREVVARLSSIQEGFPGLGRVRAASVLAEHQGFVIYEGAQGALLDARYGFFPHVSVTRTGPQEALALAHVSGRGQPRALAVLRALPTRHGPGPFVTYDPQLTAARPDIANGFGRWQREFRVGWFDLLMTRYALSFTTADAIALTCLDRLEGLREKRVCWAYSLSERERKQANVLSQDIEEFFVVDGCWPNGSLRIRDLRPPSEREHVPEKLTSLLLTMTPVWEHLPTQGGAEALVEVVEREVGLPVVLRSLGQTATDKNIRDGFLACDAQARPNLPHRPRSALRD